MEQISGIGYEVWGDVDEMLDDQLCTKQSFHIANVIRSGFHPTIYKSSSILGQDLTLEEFCDTIAEAGVLATEPGQFSYGLGAAVLGRIIEVLYEDQFGEEKKLSTIFREMLFDPLGMGNSTFFLTDGDPRVARVPTLYGIKVAEDLSLSITPAAESCAECSPEYSNDTDHYAGPRKQESGDTGVLMTVEDYGRFMDFLTRDGVSESGERLLSSQGIETLTGKWVKGLDLDSGLARLFNCAGTLNENVLPRSFQFGWSIAKPSSELNGYDLTEHPAECTWDGYANTAVHYYRHEDSWIILAPQVMCHGPAGLDEVRNALRWPAVREFQDLWR